MFIALCSLRWAPWCFIKRVFTWFALPLIQLFRVKDLGKHFFYETRWRGNWPRSGSKATSARMVIWLASGKACVFHRFWILLSGVARSAHFLIKELILPVRCAIAKHLRPRKVYAGRFPEFTHFQNTSRQCLRAHLYRMYVSERNRCIVLRHVRVSKVKLISN